MNDWWKNPVLQGPENDYGDYDYLAEKLPKDYGEWIRHSKCDTCGKERTFVFRVVNHFYCWDGWDSMDYNECWKCVIERKIWSIKHKLKKKIKIVETTFELYKDEPKWNMKKCYNLALKLHR